MSLIQKLAAASPHFNSFLTAHAQEIVDSPFSGEIYEDLQAIEKRAGELEKKAGIFGSSTPPPPTMGQRMGHAAGQLGGGLAMGVAGGILTAIAGDAYDAIKRGLTKGRNFKAMIEENPDLKQLPSKDVQRAFSVLHQFNPEFASNPTVAGSFVRRQAQFAEFDPNQLNTLVGARNNLVNAKKLPQGASYRIEGLPDPLDIEEKRHNLRKSQAEADQADARAAADSDVIGMVTRARARNRGMTGNKSA